MFSGLASLSLSVMWLIDTKLSNEPWSIHLFQQQLCTRVFWTLDVEEKPPVTNDMMDNLCCSMHLPPVALQNIFFAIQQKYKAPQIESSTCNCSTKGWLWQLWIVAVVDILTWAVADLCNCCFLLLQIVIVVVLYFVHKLALAVVDCYAETEFLGHGVASLNAFGNFFLQLLHTKILKISFSIKVCLHRHLNFWLLLEL